jgi:sugar lactone lactonase YvrE
MSRLGSGGMGRVFLCRSAGGRTVAVKLIRADLAADPEFRARFGREVAAARKVSGLYTAALVDADVDGEVPWLATAYIPGPSLTDAVAAHGPLPPAAVLMLAAGLAEGLAAIHAAGVVHRDLKPSNVLLAEDGPRVIDFGISRAMEASVLTSTGLIVGSPGFMSPEQAEGGPVGPPSDVFSLGAVLVFAATGRSPFGTGSTPALVYRVVHAVPDLGDVPADIRSLAGRCLAKEPGMRPAAAELLAELDCTGITAGWPVATEIARRASFSLPASAAPVSEAGRQDAARADEAPRPGIEPAVTRAQDPDPAATVTRAAGPSRSLRPPSSPAGLVAALADPAGRAVYAVAFSANGDVLATANDSGQIHLWDTSTGRRTATFADRASGGVMSIAFEPDGDLLAAADGNGRIYLWDVVGGELAFTLNRRRSHGMNGVAFGLDGDVLAAASASGRVYLWDMPSVTLTATFTGPGSQGMTTAAFEPGGELLAAAGDSGQIHLWDILTGKLTATFAAPATQGVTDIAFAPEDDMLAAADTSGQAFLWNTARSELSRTFGTPDTAPACSVTFRPDGRTLASAHADGQIRVWDAQSGDLTRTYAHPASQCPNSLAFRPDGAILAAGDANGTIYLWNAGTQTS